MGTSGTVNNAFLAGLLGGVGDQMMTHEQRQYEQKLRELQLKREVLAALSSDKTASPQAQALALQGLLSSAEQPKAKGIRGKLGQHEGQSQLDQIIEQIKGMPAQTLPAKPPIQVPGIPAVPQMAQPSAKPMSEVPPVPVPGMPPMTAPKLGMTGAPPQLPQTLPGISEVPGLKADPSQIVDPKLAEMRLQDELITAAEDRDIKRMVEAGVPTREATEGRLSKYPPAARASAQWKVESGPEGLPIGIRDPEGKLHTRQDPSVPSDVAAEYDARLKAHETQRAEKQADAQASDVRTTRRMFEGISAHESVHEREQANTAVRKRVDRYVDDRSRRAIMASNAPAALAGNQQAMVLILTNHVGMTLGLQRGARITRAQFEEAAQSAPWLQRVAARWDANGYLQGVVLTPQQIQQMVQLANERVTQSYEDVKDEAQEMGVSLKKVAPGLSSPPPGNVPSMPPMQNPYR